VVSELRFAFVYRFGSYPLTKKYRWRLDVDQEYRDIIEGKASELETQRDNERNTLRSIDEVRKAFNMYYEKAYQKRLKENAEQEGGSGS